MSTLELIDYLHVSMNNLIDVYKENKYINLKPCNLFIVVRKLFELTPKIKIEKKHRKKVVLKCLQQMISNEYIESYINWEEYNTLISMIDKINLSEIEEEVFMNEKYNICMCDCL
jgi:adenosyl cobinamide kinase/adenosyl cobinamide phosphate guanylyltransferase